MDGTEIYQNFNTGRPQVFQALGDSVADLNKGYLEEATAIKQLQDRMSQSWTGSSGDAASAGAGPLGTAFRDSSLPLSATTNAMSTQTSTLSTAKSSVVPVPPAPQKPSGWSTALKAAIPIVGPSMAVGDIRSYQDGMDKHNAANETNVRVMQQYSSATSSTQSTIPTSYQPLTVDGASVSVKPPGLNVTAGHLTSEYTGPTQPPSSVGSQSHSSATPSAPVSAPPTIRGTDPAIVSTPPGGQVGSPVRRPPATTPGGTDASRYVPGGGANSGDSQRAGGSRTSTGTDTDPLGRNSSGRNNSAAGRLYGSDEDSTNRRGGGAAGERLGRGGAGGSGSEGGKVDAENRLGAGKTTGGGGGIGNAAAAEQAAAGRVGAKGASGAPMGAGGQRGRGADDEEHQRPDYLLEADPDSIFGNDIRTPPPVIGE